MPAHPCVVCTAKTDDLLGGTDVRIVAVPDVGGAKIDVALAGQQPIGLGARHYHELAMERADAENRAQPAVLPQHEGLRVARQMESVAEERKARRSGNPARRARGRRPIGLGIGLPNRSGDGLADEVQLRHQIDPVPHLRALAGREELVEDPAGVGQADDHDVARIRDLVAEEDAHDAQSDILSHLAVGGPVVPGARHSARQEKPAGLVVGLENALPRKTDQRPLVDRLPPVGLTQHPVVDGVLRGGLRDVGQGWVEQVVAERRRIDQHQSHEIRVDAILQRQIHQHGPGEKNVQPLRRPRLCKVPVLGVEQKQQQLFRESHDLAASVGLVSPASPAAARLRSSLCHASLLASSFCLNKCYMKEMILI